MKGYTSRKYEGVPVGLFVRRDIANVWIYRVRRGNGFYGTKVGEQIQDRYTYFVPDSINNVEGEASREKWAAAVLKWQEVLSEQDKKEYNTRATKGLRMSGFNLFMREEMREVEGMIVNRGDPSAADFSVNDFTKDGSYHDLDLSGIVPAGAVAVALSVLLLNVNPNQYVSWRRNGNVNAHNRSQIRTQAANVYIGADIIVFCDAGRVVEYNFNSSSGWTIYVVVKGWWTA